MLDEGPRPAVLTCYTNADWLWAKIKAGVGDWIVICSGAGMRGNLSGLCWIKTGPNKFQKPFAVHRATAQHRWRP